ncbi:MAG: type III secretion system export apparatus subunit SctV [Enterovibrio sp.]
MENIIKLRGEIAILTLMFLILSMLLIPLNSLMLDALIAINITLAVLLFLSSIFMKEVLALSTFPSILLITTLFRLALSISTTRSILVEGNAGDIIATFGQFVIAGNVVVGVIVFSIITIVQFIVITKGSERVAEVSARFSLDGLPGKQMSIDADVRAGSIDANEAVQKRKRLEKESQLFGSMDGALKFVKGDAIAGIIIILINIIGGISMGMGSESLSFSQALQKYTILTIGDGLVAQIPALLISIAAGFIVTKTEDEHDNLGDAIFNQLVRENKIMLYAGIVCLLMSLIPGMPIIVFLTLCAIFMTAFFYTNKLSKSTKLQDEKAEKEESFTIADEGDGGDDPTKFDVENALPEMVTIMLVIDNSFKSSFIENDFPNQMKLQFFYKNGLVLPKINFKFSNLANKNIMTLYVNEVEASKITFFMDFSRISNSNGHIEDIIDNNTVLRVNFSGEEEVWCQNDKLDKLKELGFIQQTVSCMDHVINTISSDLLANVKEYFGIQEVKLLMDKVDSHYPELIKEVYRAAPIPRLTEVLQRLIVEGISIRNIKVILETIAQLGQREKDNLLLCEYIRSALSRYITDKYSIDNVLNVIVVSPDIESVLQSSIKQSNSGVKLILSAENRQMIYDKLDKILYETAQVSLDVVLLSSTDVRRYIKSAISSRYPRLEVLSVDEIYETATLNTVGVL